MVIDCTTVWSDCLEVIRKEVDEQSFNTWFKPITPLKSEGDVLTIQVPSQFFYEWLEEHYVPVLRKGIHQVMGPNGRLQYSVIVDSGNQKNPPLMVNYPNGAGIKRYPSQSSNGNPEDYSPFSVKALNPLTVNSRLNPNYTFENFVEGQNFGFKLD